MRRTTLAAVVAIATGGILGVVLKLIAHVDGINGNELRDPSGMAAVMALVGIAALALAVRKALWLAGQRRDFHVHGLDGNGLAAKHAALVRAANAPRRSEPNQAAQLEFLQDRIDQEVGIIGILGHLAPLVGALGTMIGATKGLQSFRQSLMRKDGNTAVNVDMVGLVDGVDSFSTALATSIVGLFFCVLLLLLAHLLTMAGRQLVGDIEVAVEAQLLTRLRIDRDLLSQALVAHVQSIDRATAANEKATRNTIAKLEELIQAIVYRRFTLSLEPSLHDGFAACFDNVSALRGKLDYFATLVRKAEHASASNGESTDSSDGNDRTIPR